MNKKYSQVKAMLAIAKASFISILKTPSSVVLGFFFPIVLILVLGSMGNENSFVVNVAFSPQSDTNNVVYQSIIQSPIFHITRADDKTLMQDLKKGEIAAILSINKTANTLQPYQLHVKSSSASQLQVSGLQTALHGIINQISLKEEHIPQIVKLTNEEVQGRKYRKIDFYLPSMLSFSVIGTAIFGVAFLFFSLRQTLVLKRMFASPVSKLSIVLGECLGRISYEIISVLVLVLFGTIFYHFTLANGIVTFFEILFFVLLGLIVFMGFGFFVSAVSKSQNLIPIYSNLFVFPQFFLSGTFFSKTLLPANIQWLIDILPLTALNDALRKVSFEGVSILSCWKEISVLGVWGILIYLLTIKVFKWE